MEIIPMNVMLSVAMELTVAVGMVMLTWAGIWTAVVSMVLVEVVVHIAMKVRVAAVIIGTCTDECSAIEPFRPVVAVGSAVVRGIAIVAIGADRWTSTKTDPYRNLSV